MMEERHKQRENKERGEEEDDGGRLEACQLTCFVLGSETSSCSSSYSSRLHAGSPGPVRHGHKGG